MLVLRKDERIGVRADAAAHRSEHRARNLAAGRPTNIAVDTSRPRAIYGTRQPDLTIQLERAGLHGVLGATSSAVPPPD